MEHQPGLDQSFTYAFALSTQFQFFERHKKLVTVIKKTSMQIHLTQPAIKCSKLTTETLEQGVI